ncbi:hypothetical protein Hanom_Chr10g00907031 [Helianthus anomalus]
MLPSVLPLSLYPSSFSPLDLETPGNQWFHSRQHRLHLSYPGVQLQLDFALRISSQFQAPLSCTIAILVE